MTQNPIKIALWSPKGSGLHYGGPGMTAYRMYSTESAMPFSLELCHGWGEQVEYDLFAKQHFIRSIAAGRAAQIGFVWHGREWVREHIKRFDIFHGLQGFQMTVAPAWTAQQMGVPSFVKVAAHQADLAGSRFSRLMGIRASRIRMLRQLSGVIAISSEIQQECIDCGISPDRVHYIPNGVDTNQFQPRSQHSNVQELRQSLGLKDLPTITFAGSLVRRKRPHLLVAAVNELKKTGLEVQLVLVGPMQDSDYFKELQNSVKDYRLSELVHFAGMQADVRPYLHAADVFALPSMNEGLANAALEALACGVPCVLTPMSGATDLLSRHLCCGLICQPNASELAEGIKTIIEDSTLREDYGKNAVQNVKTVFSSDIVLRTTLDLFRSCL